MNVFHKKSFIEIRINCTHLFIISPDHAKFKNIIATKLRDLSELLKNAFLSSTPDYGPIVFTFYTKGMFVNSYGEQSIHINREVSIALYHLVRITGGFNEDLLHKISRVAISDTPIDSSDLTFEEICSPGIVKGQNKKRNKTERQFSDLLCRSWLLRHGI